MSHFQINTTQWRELLNNYRQNRCPQQSFLVEKVNKYFPTSVWKNWDEVIRNPAILNKVSKAADIDEVYNILEANRIPRISEKSILHTALHLSYKYDIPYSDCCRCGLMRNADIRSTMCHIQQFGGLESFHKQCEVFAEISKLDLMCIIVQQSEKVCKLLKT